MKVTIGPKAVDKTWQHTFSKEVKCECGSTAPIAFVSHELDSNSKEKLVCHLYENDPNGKGLWPHDAVAVAVYICRGCFNPIAEMNQA